jgi:predicted phage terminase large subunit-like protein
MVAAMVPVEQEEQDDIRWLVGPEWYEQDRAWAQDDLISFVRRLSPRYRPAWFHFLIAAKLRGVLDGTIKRIIFVLPPRHGKSTLCSRYFPAWYLGNNPDGRIIAVSYGDRLADRFGRFTRNVINDHAYPFDLSLARDSRAADQFDIAGHAGGYFATGVGGALTGEGADVLMLDDLVKGAREADSEAFREGLIEWYVETAYPRLEAGGAIVMIGTRWREDDLIGYVIEQQQHGGDQWEIVHLPAISDAGEALWPERFGLDELGKRKANMSSRMWEAQYQGRPAPVDGGVFKKEWWRYWQVIPALDSFDSLIQSWDMTFRETQYGSYIVGQVWGAIDADRYLLDQVRLRADFPGAVAEVRSLSARWPQTHEKLIEAKANGPAVVATLKHEIAGLIEVEPEGGKEARANAVAWQVESGNVFLPDPKSHPWVRDLIQEATGFPTAAHDDQVDAMTQALVRMQAYQEFDALPVVTARGRDGRSVRT